LNDVELKSSERVLTQIVTENNDMLVSLDFNQLNLKDAGQIKVQAINSEGKTCSLAMLTVKGKFHSKVIVFGHSLSSFKASNASMSSSAGVFLGRPMSFVIYISTVYLLF